MHVLYPVVLATLLFCVGVYGVLARRNLILVLMSVELMLNAVNLNLVTFDVWLRDALHSGQVLALFVIVIAAAEVGLGLALVLQLFRSHATVAVDAARGLAERPRRGRTAALQRQAEAEPVRAEPRGGPQHAPDPEWWREHR